MTDSLIPSLLFRRVPGLDDLAVTDRGVVAVVETRQLLLSAAEKRGDKHYLRVRWRGKYYYTHRLVAAAYCKNPVGEGGTVRFRDGNTLNIAASNLYWARRGREGKKK